MKQLLGTLKSARWIEILLIIVLLCVLILLGTDSEKKPLSLERRMEQALSAIEGAGRVQVILGEEDAGGAVVICDGADNIAVMLDLQRSVKALTGLPAEKIEIIKSD